MPFAKCSEKDFEKYGKLLSEQNATCPRTAGVNHCAVWRSRKPESNTSFENVTFAKCIEQFGATNFMSQSRKEEDGHDRNTNVSFF